MRFEIERTVRAPVERVFALVSDIRQRPQWVGIARERTPLDDSPVGAGSRFRAVDKIPGRTVTYVQTIERHEPPTLLEESWDGPMGGRSIIRFSGDATSTTMNVAADVASPLPGPLSFLEPLARRWAARLFDQDLTRLEHLLDQGHS